MTFTNVKHFAASWEVPVALIMCMHVKSLLTDCNDFSAFLFGLCNSDRKWQHAANSIGGISTIDAGNGALIFMLFHNVPSMCTESVPLP